MRNLTFVPPAPLLAIFLQLIDLRPVIEQLNVTTNM
jgi:hypothetical protein